MRRKKLIFSFLLVLSLFFVFSFFFVEKNHSHECNTVNCEICEQILNYEKKINELKLTTSNFSHKNNLPKQFLSNQFLFNCEIFQVNTLISLKTKLLA
jgi:hypothetical protein